MAMEMQPDAVVTVGRRPWARNCRAGGRGRGVSMAARVRSSVRTAWRCRERLNF